MKQLVKILLILLLAISQLDGAADSATATSIIDDEKIWDMSYEDLKKKYSNSEQRQKLVDWGRRSSNRNSLENYCDFNRNFQIFYNECEQKKAAAQKKECDIQATLAANNKLDGEIDSLRHTKLNSLKSLYPTLSLQKHFVKLYNHGNRQPFGQLLFDENHKKFYNECIKNIAQNARVQKGSSLDCCTVM